MSKDARKQQVQESRANILKRITKLEGPNFFTEAVSLPTEFAAAIMSSRPELLRAVKPRALNAEECDVLYKLISTLIETNMALREHAQEVATMTKGMLGGFTTVQRVGDQIEAFANFREAPTPDEE
jgi:hypothetical protein